MSSSKWEVSYFMVQTSNSNGTSDSVYANGNMQVPIDVYIKATVEDKDGNSSPYSLTDAELKTIELVKYSDVSTQISGDWTYTGTKNDFDHTFPGSGTSSALLKADSDNSPQSIRYWISTTKVENENIAASIEQGNGKTVTTHGDDYDSHVTITGVQPITYTTTNINIEKVDGDGGTYVWGRTTNGEKGNDDKKKWDQKNWYISTSKYDLKRADVCPEYDTSSDDPGRPNLDKCYAFRTNHDNLKLFYIFNMSDSSPRNFGFNNSWDWSVYDWGAHETYNVHDDAYAVVSANINQKANTLNLSRFHFEHSGNTADLPWGGGNNPDPHGYDEWECPCAGFQLWDRYGNTGTFNATYDQDHDNVVIKDTTSTGTSNFVKPSAEASAKVRAV